MHSLRVNDTCQGSESSHANSMQRHTKYKQIHIINSSRINRHIYATHIWELVPTCVGLSKVLTASCCPKAQTG